MPLPFIQRRRGPRGPGSSEGGTWTPLALGAKLKGWWHADDTSGSPASWNDRIAALALTSSGSPTSTLTNGYRYVNFDGTDDYFRGSAATLGLPTGATVGEIWALVSDDAATQGRKIMCYGTATGAGGGTRQLGHVNTPPINLQAVGSGATAHTDTGHTLAGVAVVSGYFGTTVNGGRINGEATVPATTAHSGTLNTTTASTTIGASNAASPTNFWQGKMRHVMATLELTLAEQNKLEAWLAWDVARNDLLPVGHPYRSARP